MKRSLAGGQEIRGWDVSANLFTALYYPADTLLLNHRDQDVLERYIALKLGLVAWR